MGSQRVKHDSVVLFSSLLAQPRGAVGRASGPQKGVWVLVPFPKRGRRKENQVLLHIPPPPWPSWWEGFKKVLQRPGRKQVPTRAWDTGSSKLPRAGGQDAPQATAPHPQDPLPNTPAPLPCEGTTSLGAPSEWSLLALSACESWQMNCCESSPLTPAPPGSGGLQSIPAGWGSLVPSRQPRVWAALSQESGHSGLLTCSGTSLPGFSFTTESGSVLTRRRKAAKAPLAGFQSLNWQSLRADTAASLHSQLMLCLPDDGEPDGDDGGAPRRPPLSERWDPCWIPGTMRSNHRAPRPSHPSQDHVDTWKPALLASRACCHLSPVPSCLPQILELCWKSQQNKHIKNHRDSAESLFPLTHPLQASNV